MCAGFLIDFISGPVSVGFTSAAAILIATAMLKDLLGLPVGGNKFLGTVEAVVTHLGQTRLWDTLLGITCMAILLFLRVGVVLYSLLFSTNLKKEGSSLFDIHVFMKKYIFYMELLNRFETF